MKFSFTGPVWIFTTFTSYIWQWSFLSHINGKTSFLLPKLVVNWYFAGWLTDQFSCSSTNSVTDVPAFFLKKIALYRLACISEFFRYIYVFFRCTGIVIYMTSFLLLVTVSCDLFHLYLDLLLYCVD